MKIPVRNGAREKLGCSRAIRFFWNLLMATCFCVHDMAGTFTLL